MAHYNYLIIGGGMAADGGVKGIREVDASGTIAVVGMEPHPPYARPPLSKKLWQGKPLESIWRGTEKLGIDLYGGRKVTTLDPARRQVQDDRGETYGYDRLLIATGGTPRRLPFGGDDIIYFRTLDDYRRLRGMVAEGKRFAVIGGGFIGSEIAAALVMNGMEVTMLFPEEAICSRVFPPDVAGFLNSYYREKGTEVLPGETATDVRREGKRLLVATSGGRKLEVDGVVAGLGIAPEVELARQAGLPVENGITTDEFLRVGNADIFAAGDAASFYNPLLAMRMRVEHEDNAVEMGRQAGRNMAGASEPYHHLPYFYSDLFDVGYEAVGELDGRLEVVADWKTPYREGVLYYLREGKLRGVLLWNVWEQVEAARRLMAEAGPFDGDNLKGRLPVKG